MSGAIETLWDGLQEINNQESFSSLTHFLMENGFSILSMYSRHSRNDEATERTDPAVFSLFMSI
jgi:hypothetical protein